METDWMTASSLDDGVGRLMQIVWPLRDAVIQLVSKINVRVSVVSVVEVINERPEYLLSQQNLERMAQLGAEFSMDLYDFR